jgi:hypothetical protein
VKTRSFVLAVLLVSCAGPVDKVEEDDLPVDGKLDSFGRPSEHGTASFGSALAATLEPSARYHAWDFVLTAGASVRIATGPAVPDGPEVDTVVYLYRRRASGWGRYVARNDDSGGTLWSSLTRSLEAGTYRVLVKGYGRGDLGDFALEVTCDGAGCGGVDECLFGDTFHALREGQAGLEVTHAETLTRDSAIDATLGAQIVRALHASSHTDVETVEQAFDRVDEGLIERYEVSDGDERRFRAIEYGAGDNSYGAIFVGGTADVAAEIHDGDLYECVVGR